MEWFTLHEIAIASAQPKPMPLDAADDDVDFAILFLSFGVDA